MIITLLVSLVALLVLLLCLRFASLDRGVDIVEKEKVIVGSEPYVPPEVDAQIKEEMERLQQVVFPVQYIDNGLLARLPEQTTAVQAAINGISYDGPAPFNAGASGAHLDNMEKRQFIVDTSQIDRYVSNTRDVAYDENMIQPYNSIDNLVVSEGETIDEF